MSKNYIILSPVAESIPYDPENDPNCILLENKENIQEALEALCEAIQNKVSPGFTYGRSGKLNTDTYLLNDTVPSNISGRTIPIDGFVTKVAISVGAPENYSLVFEEHDGVTFSTIATVNMVVGDGRQKTFDLTGANVTKDKQLAVRVGSGKPKNVDISVTLNQFE